MKIAVEGCAHGELEVIYDTLQHLEKKESIKIDLLICCGDFQSTRNEGDLLCMAVPPKYSKMCTFYKYYTGEKLAPILTIFIGGNHESSNYLQELPYGGWVAPNIYYLGYAGVINIAGVRIGGLSGIYKSSDYMKGHYEKAPYNENTKRTVYHIRNLEIFRLKQLSGPIDILLSHDWPNGIYNYGDVNSLLERKPFFRDDIESGQLGSKPTEELLLHLKPRYWFASHLHCKFAALVRHEDQSVTKFLALDKCLPRRQFLQLLDIPHDYASKIEITYDLEWLTILHMTNHLLSVKNMNTFMPGPGGVERYNFTPSEEDKRLVLARFNNDLRVPNNFEKSAPGYNTGSPTSCKRQPEAQLNSQTVLLCDILAIDDPICLLSKLDGSNLNLSFDRNTSSSFIDDTIEDSILPPSSTPIKRLSGNLSLPEPKTPRSDSTGFENLTSYSKAYQSTPISEDIEKDTRINESDTQKTFKRRNGNLYNSINESM